MVSGKAFAAKCWKVIEGGTALNLKPHRHAEEEFSSSHARSHQARPKLSIHKCSYQCSGHVVNTMSNKLLRQSTSIILSTLLEVVDGPNFVASQATAQSSETSGSPTFLSVACCSPPIPHSATEVHAKIARPDCANHHAVPCRLRPGLVFSFSKDENQQTPSEILSKEETRNSPHVKSFRWVVAASLRKAPMATELKAVLQVSLIWPVRSPVVPIQVFQAPE